MKELKKKFHPAQIVILAILMVMGLGISSYPFKIKAAPGECDIDVGDLVHDKIPADCEGEDVVVNTGVTIDTGAVQINQTAGGSCSQADNPNCDTKRHFKSLTIKDGGMITHSPITAQDDWDQDTNHDNWLRDNDTGSARWKKVDIEVDENITIEKGGHINVDGKGHPGAYFEWCDGRHIYSLVTSDGVVPGYPEISDDYPYPQRFHLRGVLSRFDNTKYGFGPGGGVAFRDWDFSPAGGGGYGADGGHGRISGSETSEWVDTEEWIFDNRNYWNMKGSKQYNPWGSDVGNKWSTRLEYGSGGGANGVNTGDDDTSCAQGGSGGGIISLKTKGKLIFAADIDPISGIFSDTPISARGANGYMFQDDGNSIGSGGGSGGVVRIVANQGIDHSKPLSIGGLLDLGSSKGQIIREPADISYEPLVWLGYIDVYGSVGSYSINTDPPRWPVTNSNYGAGGWVMINTEPEPIPPPPPEAPPQMVTVTVKWMEGNREEKVELKTILRDVR